MCSCAAFTVRGCFEHSGRDPELIAVYRLGYDDGRMGRSIAQAETFYLTPMSRWTAAEQEHYRAGHSTGWRPP